MNDLTARTALVLGNNAVRRLQAAHVAVLGLGGVGGYAVEALTRSGVGELTLVDEDVFSPTNLNRQLLATVDTIGRPKAEVAAQRVASIDPACTVHPLRLRYEAASRESFFSVPYDYIIDAIDLVSCKLDLIETAHTKHIPIISALGTGDKLDGAAFSITDISKTEGCHLARILRKELRRRGILHHKVVFSPELPHRAPAVLKSASNDLQNSSETSLFSSQTLQTFQENACESPPPGRRSIPGSTPWSPAIAGLLLAQAVIIDLTKCE